MAIYQLARRKISNVVQALQTEQEYVKVSKIYLIH